MSDVVANKRGWIGFGNDEFPTGMRLQIVGDEVVGWDFGPKIGSKDMAFVFTRSINLVKSLLSEGARVIPTWAKGSVILAVGEELVVGFISVMLVVILGCETKERKPAVTIISKGGKHGCEEW